MKRFIIEQSDKEFYISHSGLALIGLCINKLCSLPAKAREAFPVSNGIGLDDIVRSYVGLLTLGQSDFEAIANRKKDDFFRHCLGIGRVPSAETLIYLFPTNVALYAYTFDPITKTCIL